MGKSESAKECKRHPNHNLLPGICPSCLREKLQQFQQSSSIHNSDSHSTFSSSSSTTSSTEFFFSTDSSRRRRHPYHHRRNASEFVPASMAADLFGNNLKKSGSIRISADGPATAATAKGGGRKKLGFWSRLLVRPKALYFS